MALLIQDILRNSKSSEADDQQLHDFNALFHDSEIEFELKGQLFNELNHTEPSSLDQKYLDTLFEKFWRSRREDKSFTFSLRRISSIAALLIAGLFLGYFLNSISKSSSPKYFTSVAPNGSISELLLPEGSHVFLNSGSTIKYALEGNNEMRQVYLSGEAWFQVSKLKGKPFLVHTPSYDVLVTGTCFNVKGYPDEKEVTTTLEEGCVHVTSSDHLKLGNETILKPGEQLIYHKETGVIEVFNVDTQMYSAWKDNKMVFINMSLRDLKILLERKYGVLIEINDPGVLDYHYDGTLKNESILEVMDILKQTLPIKYEVIGQKIVINKK